MKNCHCETEINRDGSGQLGRYLKALDPTYAPIDGRTTEDLLVFAKKYAAQIRFYDIPESQLPGSTPSDKISWREFFRRDMSVIASSIALTETQNFKKEYDQANEKLQTQPTPEIYAALYAPIVGMLKKIDRWYSVAIPQNPLYDDLKLAIDSDLKDQARKIVAYEKGFTYVDPGVDLKIDLDGIENQEAWGLLEVIHADPGIYTGTTIQDKIWSASLFTEDIFHAFYNFLNTLIRNSEKYIEFAMEQYPAHQPHMALFITFLQLFGKAREQMNGLTGRMLDFYYKEVLHLESKPSLPDKAHIVFELAKEVAEYNLEMGTTLVAGPDKSNVDQLYRTSDDLVINQAKVKELKTIFVEKIESGTTTSLPVISTIYARPIANSADGFGEKFTGTDLRWPTFGIGTPANANPKNTCEEIEYLKEIISRKDQARIGFAIASPQLLLQEGNRLIEIKLTESAKTLFAKQVRIAKAGKKEMLEIWFTGEKDWFKVDKVMGDNDQIEFNKFLDKDIFNPMTNDLEASYYLQDNSLFVYLPISAHQVIEYDKKVHSTFAYNTSMPVMQVLLSPEINLSVENYKRLSANNFSLNVRVGSILPMIPIEVEALIAKFGNATVLSLYNMPPDGLSKLNIHNDTSGVLPAGKAFDPFTAYPNIGKSLYIGGDEVFNKRLDKLAVDIKKTIETEPAKNILASISRDLVEYRVSILEKRKWKALSPVIGHDFSQLTLKSNILNKFESNDKGAEGVNTQLKHERLPLLKVNEWMPGVEKNFIRLTNLRALNGVKDNLMQVSQNMAPELEIKELHLNYKSELTKLEIGVDEFYHVYPFGNIETYLSYSPDNTNDIIFKRLVEGRLTKADTLLSNDPFRIADKNKDYLLVNAGNLLLPQFTFVGPNEHYSTTAQPENEKKINAGKLAAKKIGDELAEKLILDASGWATKINGGDNQYSGHIQEEGMLFIGLEKAKPLQSISMLFQFAEGSAKDEDQDSPEIHWSYLTNNEWRPLKEENVISDSTLGFQTTGIVKIELPEDASTNNTVISTQLHWLCASVTIHSNRIPMLIDIVTQAVEVSFEDQKNDSSHFDLALPAGSISKLENPVTEVNKVAQPFSSFDGKHQEIGREYYTRVSERLRHKARAITPWDYEHLVLDQFPSIYKVKCITHTDPECLCREPEKRTAVTAPGFVLKSCGFDPVDLKYKPEKLILTDESSKALVEIIEKLKAKECNILLAAEHQNSDTEALNKIRLEDLASQIIASDVSVNRIAKSQTPSVKIDIVTISDIPIEVPSTGIDPVTTKEVYCCGPQIAPGHILLVPISNLKNRNAINPLQPKTSRRVLLEIEAYLKKRVSPFVHVHAKNPVYEEVLVFFRVKFMVGKDKGFHLKKLNEEIVHFLTPWAFSDVAEVQFGQKIYASSIINFIEERIYVDFITDFLMLVCRKGCCDEILAKDYEAREDDVLTKITGCNDMEVLLQDDDDFIGDIIAKPSTARSILVSAPRHIIIPYQEPVTLTPCETRKLNLLSQGKIINKAKITERIKDDNAAAPSTKKTQNTFELGSPKQVLIPLPTAPERLKDSSKAENRTAVKKRSVKSVNKEKIVKKKK